MVNETQKDSRAQVTSPQPAVLLEDGRKLAMVGYNILLAFVFSGSLIYCVALLPYEPDSSPSAKPTPTPTSQPTPTQAPNPIPETQPTQSNSKPSAKPTPTPSTSQPTPTQAPNPIPETQPKESNSNQTVQPDSLIRETTRPSPAIWLATMFTLVAAGGLGGVLRNFHGLFIHTYEEGGLPAELEQHYYLRPLTGAVLGLFTLFLGHLITSTSSDGAKFTWTTPAGRMPYTGIALLAGFASAEFIGRMKAVAESLFQERQIPIRDQLRRLKGLKEEGLISDEVIYKQKEQSIIDKFR